MTEIADPAPYEELLHSFKVAVLKHVLREGDLPPTCLNFDLSLIQALGDIAQRTRWESTRELAAEAFRAFANYAAEQNATSFLSNGT